MEASLFNCCGSSKWSKGVAALGPFDDRAKLLEAARKVWWNDCNVTDWLEAFTAHPRIGVSVQEEARVVGDERGRVEVEGSIPVSCVFFRRERERGGLTPKCSRACSATCGRYPNLGASTSNNRKRWVQESAVCVSQSASQ